MEGVRNSILEVQENRKRQINSNFMDSEIIKGKGHPEGTVKIWSGEKFIKQAGKWVYQGKADKVEKETIVEKKESKKEVQKFTFRTDTPTGRYRSFDSAFHEIKLKGEIVGQISEKLGFPTIFSVGFKVDKADINEDGNPNVSWKWIYLKKKTTSLQEMKDFLNDNIEKITSQFKLYSDKKEEEKKETKSETSNTSVESVKKDLVDVLRKETETLRVQYIELTKKYAKESFDSMVERSKWPVTKWYDRYGIKYAMKETSKGLVPELHGQEYNRKDLYRMRDQMNLEDKIVNNIGFEKYEAKEVKYAEEHYEGSIQKLASRIKEKNLNEEKLRTVTSHVGVNIETTLTDGEKTVKAFTIIASGPIQRPHYRYLVN